MTNRSITDDLELLERKWVSALETRFDGTIPWPLKASDEVQFFSADSLSRIEERTTSAENASVAPRPLHDACVAISYNAYSHAVLGKVTPHIHTRTKGETWVLDDKRSQATRRALTAVLEAYASDPQTWVANGYASATDLLSATIVAGAAPQPIVLIKTFISPFLLTKPWSEFSGTARKATLEAWDPNEHICDLIETIGDRVDLWVIHGSAVWPHFATNSQHIQRWDACADVELRVST